MLTYCQICLQAHLDPWDISYVSYHSDLLTAVDQTGNDLYFLVDWKLLSAIVANKGIWKTGLTLTLYIVIYEQCYPSRQM